MDDAKEENEKSSRERDPQLLAIERCERLLGALDPSEALDAVEFLLVRARRRFHRRDQEHALQASTQQAKPSPQTELFDT